MSVSYSLNYSQHIVVLFSSIYSTSAAIKCSVASGGGPHIIFLSLLYCCPSTETQVRVMFDYTAQQPDELSIEVGETLEVLSNEVEEGWWKVCSDCTCTMLFKLNAFKK